MKKYPIQIISIIGLLAFLLTACSDESPVTGALPGKELVVSAEIAPVNTSKAIATDKLSFIADDEIKITQSGSSGSKTYQLTNSQWLPVAGGTDLTADGSSRTYEAVYPAGFISILEDQSTDSGANYAKSNKLLASVTTKSNYLPLTFSHAFAKITIVVSYKSGDSRKEVTATLSGSGIRGGSSNETIKMLRTIPEAATTSISHTFICILNPGDRGFTLTVAGTTSANVAATTEKYTQTTRTFVAGNNYIYNFSSNNNLILNSVTVEGFTGGTTNDVGDAT